MITKIFTVFDSKAEVYLVPFFYNTRGEAIRSFKDTVNDRSHPMGRHPADFTLFEIGHYDNETGICEAIPAFNLGNGVELQEQRDNGPDLFQERSR